MITAAIVLNVLETHRAAIEVSLGPEWEHFRNDLYKLASSFGSVIDDEQLEATVDRVYKICRQYPYIRELLRQSLKTSHRKERVPPIERNRPSPKAPARNIAKRFRKLIESLIPVGTYSLERFSSISFPNRITLGRTAVLRLVIASRPSGASSATLQLLNQPQLEVDAILVIISGEFEIIGSNIQTLAVPDVGDSAPAIFKLIPKAIGHGLLAVEFFQDGSFLGRTVLQTFIELSEEVVSTTDQTQSTLFARHPSSIPDLTLRIREWPLSNGQREYKFEAYSNLKALDLAFGQSMGEIVLAQDPAKYLDEVFGELNRFAEQNVKATILQERMAALGTSLYEQLFPKPLQRFYWEKGRHHVNSLQIISDEPWIPWEIVKPYQHLTDGSYQEDEFLCERFALARWLSDNPFVDELDLTVLGFVAPESNLESVQYEIQALRQLPGVTTIEIDPTLDGLYEYLKAGGVDALHFACHGAFDKSNPDQSPLLFKKELLKPSDIAGSKMTFGRDRPLVFLNACETGRIGFSLTGLGGWAKSFLRAGASCFIGPIWEVNDEAACRFAVEVYTLLLSGEPIAEAIRKARRVIQGNDATWLSYSLYANPLVYLHH